MKKKKAQLKKTKSASSSSKISDMKKKFGGVRELDITRLNVSGAAKQ
jgi:hypothetical protein